MSYSVGYPVNFTSGGDKTNQAIQKFINEFTRLYGYLNTEAAKIPADASGLDVTDAGGYFAAENIEGILQEIGALLATLGDLATEDVIDEDLLSLSDVTTGNASAAKHGFLPKLPDDDGKALLGDGTWGSIASSLYIQAIDKKSSGTDGGTATTGDWRDRTLNTLVHDDTGVVTLSSNKLTLPAGDYVIHAQTVGYACGSSMNRIYNVTGAAALLYGISAPEGANELPSFPSVSGKFTLEEESEIKLQTYNTYTRNNDGYGYALNVAGLDECYVVVQLWKVA